MGPWCFVVGSSGLERDYKLGTYLRFSCGIWIEPNHTTGGAERDADYR